MNKLVLTVTLAAILAGCDNGTVEQPILRPAKQSADRQRQLEEQARKREQEERVAKAKREKEEAERKENERILKRRTQALKIISHEVAADKEIVRRYQREVLALEEDKANFLKRLNAIEIPDYEIVTNIVTVYAGTAKKKAIAKKIKLTEHQKSVRKLMRLYEDDAVCTMYETCTDRSARKLLDELAKEWNTEEDDYNNVTKALQKIDAEEAQERQKMTAQFQSERNTRINKRGRRIIALKKQRAELTKKLRDHESGKCLLRVMQGSPKFGDSTKKCKCEVSTWESELEKVNDEINDIQSQVNAEQSTAEGLKQSSQLDQISSEASRKRAEINQEYTHQSAVLKAIADKYQQLLVEDLIDGLAKRREYLIREIEQITTRNDLKLKYIDGRSELSPEMATAFIESDDAKTISGLNLKNSKAEEERANKEAERIINAIKAFNTATINVNDTTERKSRRRRRRSQSIDR